MGYLVQKRSKGWQRATDSFASGSAAQVGAVIAPPDFAEHDNLKEVILLRKLKIRFDESTIPSLAATVDGYLMAGIRSGSKLPSTIAWWRIDGTVQKWLTACSGHITQPATENGLSVYPFAEITFDFGDEPLVLNPLGFSIGASSEGLGNFDDDNIFIEYEYQWAKSNEDYLQAYLGWEALGA